MSPVIKEECLVFDNKPFLDLSFYSEVQVNGEEIILKTHEGEVITLNWEEGVLCW